MKKLVRIRVVQFFLYEKREVVVGMSCGIFGSNGSGKSSLLDAVQIVMLGANASRGNTGVSFNAQADEGGHNTRSIRSYCLGQYGDTPDARVRDSATTYITLVWNDTVTQEILSTGVCIAASGDRDSHEVLGRYIIPVDLTLNDHLESADGKESPRSWGSFRQMLLHRAYGEEVLFHDSERFVNAMLFQLRGARGAPRLDAYRQAFRFGLRMKFDKSVDDIVRQQVLEARPTNIKRFKDVLHTFQEMAALVRSVQVKLDEADLIEADFAEAHKRYSHAISLASLAQDAELELANEAVGAAEQAEGDAANRLEAADNVRKKAEHDVNIADLHAKECASNRDKHASHADAALIKDQLGATQQRLADQRSILHRSISAIGRAIDQKIPGKLVAHSSEAAGLAFKEINALLTGDRGANRDAVESTVRRALRAAKLVSDELLAEMQTIGREQNNVKNELDGMRENQDRIAKGKPPLDRSAADLRRDLADVGIDATPVCDLVRVDDPDWQPAIESYLGGSNMQALLVDEGDEREAFRAYRKARIYEAKVVMPSKFVGRGSPKRGTVAELISGNNVAAVNYLRSKFGDTQRAETEDECFAHRFAMTKDGMLLADGEIVRKRPTDPINFKIGPTSTATRSSILEGIRRLVTRLEQLTQIYDQVKALLQSLGPFIGGEQEKVRDLLDAFDRVAKDAEAEQTLSRQLEALDTDEYRQLVQASLDADSALVGLRTTQMNAVRTFGSVESEYEQKKKETLARRAWTLTQKEITEKARAQDGYDADYASEQWDKLLERQGTSFLAIAADCIRRSKTADDESRRKASSGVQKLGGFLIKHNEFLPNEARDDWRLSRTWLMERVSVLRDTGLRQYKARMEDALSAAKSTFRNDVAVALNEHLEWLGDTVDRMNLALRAAPTFTNGERYQFRRHVRPAYAVLLKFIKDVALFGPTDDMFGGAGEMPKEFEDLMQEKTVVGSAAIKSPLDDYREFFDFDVEVFREDTPMGATKHVGWLSKRVGSGSGGEHRAPLYVIAGAAMSSAYRLERGDDTGMRLLVIDEAFIKMDPRNIVATMRYFEELGLQIFMASTGDALGTLTAFLDRYYDIMRDAESNVVLLEGHDISPSVREMFRADLPEFNPELIEQEIAKQFLPQSPADEGVAA